MSFKVEEFMPYVLAQAAERSSLGFAKIYKSKYGMLRTDWRVMFHLGAFGPMTARDICARADLHKTKVSRAVARLEDKRFLTRETQSGDRRSENLALTAAGQSAYADLHAYAAEYEDKLLSALDVSERQQLRTLLQKLV